MEVTLQSSCKLDRYNIVNNFVSVVKRPRHYKLASTN